MALSFFDIVLRLLTAMFISLVVGLERERTHRPAGLRTHMLVSLGSCIAMITGVMIWNQYAYVMGGSFDVNRLGAQVVSGVGFLGAGTIIREGNTIKGLTTAASLWACACMGLTAGAGYYDIALLCVACVFLTLTVFDRIQNLMPGFEKYDSHVEVLCYASELETAMRALRTTGNRYHANIQELTYFPEGECCRICLKVRFSTSQAIVRSDWYAKELRTLAVFRPKVVRKQVEEMPEYTDR